MPKSRNRKKPVKADGGFVPNAQAVNTAEKWSFISQPFVLMLVLFRLGTDTTIAVPTWLWVLVSGAGIFAAYSLLYIHILTRLGTGRRLLTQGPFRYTRHPFYTGVVLADTLSYWGRPFTVWFAISCVVFYGTVAFVSLLHEQEVLAKYGPEAEKYYARTPRFFFLYPFLKKK